MLKCLPLCTLMFISIFAKIMMNLIEYVSIIPQNFLMSTI